MHFANTTVIYLMSYGQWNAFLRINVAIEIYQVTLKSVKSFEFWHTLHKIDKMWKLRFCFLSEVAKNKAYCNNRMACALQIMFSEVCFHASAEN